MDRLAIEIITFVLGFVVVNATPQCLYLSAIFCFFNSFRSRLHPLER
jgi:hypothetical protein